MVFVEISSVCNYLEVILNTDLTLHVFGTTYSCIRQLLKWTNLLPKLKWPVFFQTVADLGSEVTVMKGQVDSFSQFVKTADTKLEELSNKVTKIDTV